MEDIQIVAESITTTVGGVTIGSGGSLNIASGSLKLAGGPFSLASGASLSLASGAQLNGASGATQSLASGATLTLASGAQLIQPFEFAGAPGTASVSVATASGTTIPIAQGIVRLSATAATTSGSCTLATGTLDGQQVVLINECATNMVITGNLKANQTIAASSAANFVWVSADTLWWRTN